MLYFQNLKRKKITYFDDGTSLCTRSFTRSKSIKPKRDLSGLYQGLTGYLLQLFISHLPSFLKKPNLDGRMRGHLPISLGISIITGMPCLMRGSISQRWTKAVVCNAVRVNKWRYSGCSSSLPITLESNGQNWRGGIHHSNSDMLLQQTNGKSSEEFTNPKALGDHI